MWSVHYSSPLGKPIDQQKTLSVKKTKPMIVQSRISLTKSSHLYIYIVVYLHKENDMTVKFPELSWLLCQLITVAGRGNTDWGRFTMGGGTVMGVWNM